MNVYGFSKKVMSLSKCEANKLLCHVRKGPVGWKQTHKLLKCDAMGNCMPDVTLLSIITQSLLPVMDQIAVPSVPISAPRAPRRSLCRAA